MFDIIFFKSIILRKNKNARCLCGFIYYVKGLCIIFNEGSTVFSHLISFNSRRNRLHKIQICLFLNYIFQPFLLIKTSLVHRGPNADYVIVWALEWFYKRILRSFNFWDYVGISIEVSCIFKSVIIVILKNIQLDDLNSCVLKDFCSFNFPYPQA